MLSHYTWSKMIDNVSHSSGNVSWLGGSTSLQNIWDLRGERALSSHDVAHRVVLTGAYELPFGKKRKWGTNWNRAFDWVVGGWEVSGMAVMQSGMPLQVTQSGGTIWDGTQRPNLIGDPSTSGPVQDRINNYFNPAAFSQPAADTPGTAPRNLNYRGPGIKTLDAALLKSIATWEGQRHRVAAGSAERDQHSDVRRSCRIGIRRYQLRPDYRLEKRRRTSQRAIRSEVLLLTSASCR